MNSLGDIKAVIFDMDGVIVDSESLSVASEKAVLNKHGIVIDESDWGTFKGKTTSAIFSYVIKKYHVENVTVEQMINEKFFQYMEMFDKEISIFPQFQELINYLRPKYKIALTTSSVKEMKDRILEKFDLEKYFDVIVTGDMVSNGKPHPEPYLLTLNKLGLQGSECVVVEDSDNGITSAKEAGIKTIAVTHTFPEEKLSHADFIVDGLRDIISII